MKNILVTGLLLSLLVLLAACKQDKEEEIPTLFPTAAEQQAQSTPTATEEPVVSTPVPTTVAAPPTSGRPEMPPTWTPTPTETTTPEPPASTPTEVTTIAASSTACDTFGPDFTRNPTTFELGNDVQVFWIPVEGAATYKITLVNQLGQALFEQYTAAPTYTFQADLFKAGERYGWEVIPYNDLKIQMCYGRGDELVAGRQG